MSGIKERSAEFEAPFRDFLATVVTHPARHGKFLNMLSLLEHTGSRKIMVSQAQAPQSEDLLKHVAEETRHAFFFKRQARRFAKQIDMDGYSNDNTMARNAAAHYFARLDAGISKRIAAHCSAPDVPYLGVSLIVELRACWAYPLYHQALETAGIPLSLKSIVAEEDAHLAAMYQQFSQLLAATPLSMTELSAYESHIFAKLLQHLITEVT